MGEGSLHSIKTPQSVLKYKTIANFFNQFENWELTNLKIGNLKTSLDDFQIS